MEQYDQYKQICETIDKLYPKYATDLRNWEYIKELIGERDKLINLINWNDIHALNGH